MGMDVFNHPQNQHCAQPGCQARTSSAGSVINVSNLPKSVETFFRSLEQSLKQLLDDPGLTVQAELRLRQPLARSDVKRQPSLAIVED